MTTSPAYEKQLRGLKALRHLVKRHDLQLRECSNHLKPQLLELLRDLDDIPASQQLAAVESELHGAIEAIEGEVESLCCAVEAKRAEIEEDAHLARRGLLDSLRELLHAVLSLQKLDGDVETARRQLKEDEVERSRDAFAADSSLKMLLDEKKQLAEAEAQIRATIKELDAERIAVLKAELDQLQEKKAELEAHLTGTLARQHEELANCPHLDDVAAETLAELLADTDVNAPPPTGDAQASSAEKEAQSNELPGQIKALFEVPPEQLLGDVGPFSQSERDAINAVVEQRRRERRLLTKLAESTTIYDRVGAPPSSLATALLLGKKPGGFIVPSPSGPKTVGTCDFDAVLGGHDENAVLKSDDAPRDVPNFATAAAARPQEKPGEDVTTKKPKAALRHPPHRNLINL